MLTPSSNTVLEPVTSAMVAGVHGVSARFARFRVTEIALSAASDGQFDDGARLAAADLEIRGAGELLGAAEPLDALAEADPATDVRAVFSWSYRTLSPEAARLFRLLGLHPGPDLAFGAAASIAGLPPARARSLLAEMRAAQAASGRAFGASELDTIARVKMMCGEYAAVEALLAPVLDDTVAAQASDSVALCQLTLAEMRRLDGRFADAQQALDAARRASAERGLAALQVQVRQEQAALFAATVPFASTIK